MKDWYAQGIKDKVAELLKHYLLDMNESRDFHSDCYSEVDEIVDKIDNLIKTRKGVSPYECGVEWHHNGRFIAFYPSNDDEMLKVEAFKERLSKIDITFHSKAQAMRFVEKLPDTSEDNELAIRLKDGKYGSFVCVDSLYFSDKDYFKLAPSIEIKREIERLFS